ncbi:MAG: hypothetical protein J0L75_19740 [Spirochaetes bacterium]|nr:hypothetical protein [Spirochaetota bacterium]
MRLVQRFRNPPRFFMAALWATCAILLSDGWLPAAAPPPVVSQIGPNRVRLYWTLPNCRVYLLRSTNGMPLESFASVVYGPGVRNYLDDSNAPAGCAISYAMATNALSETSSIVLLTNVPQVTLTISTCQTIPYQHLLRIRYVMGRTCVETPQAELAWAPTGTGRWTNFGPELVTRPELGFWGRFTADWSLPEDFDTKTPLDLRFVPMLGGWTGDTNIYSNVDLSGLFTTVSELVQPCILGNPCRDGSGVIFANLPTGTTVDIYTLSGKKVIRLPPEGIIGGKLRWDLRAATLERIRPGIYPCRIEDPEHRLFNLTLIVSR